MGLPFVWHIEMPVMGLSKRRVIYFGGGVRHGELQ